MQFVAPLRAAMIGGLRTVHVKVGAAGDSASLRPGSDREGVAQRACLQTENVRGAGIIGIERLKAV
jgi:hypothetical protein